MGLHDNTPKRWWHAFGFALQGIVRSVQQESHMQFHVLAAIVVVMAGMYYQVSTSEWLMLIGWISAVVALELVNTAIEACVDLCVNTQYHVLAKYAKDVAAGAVLVVALGAAVSGAIIFIPYIWK